MLVYLICATGVLSSAVMAVEFIPCKGSGSALAPESVDLTGCDKSPCPLKKGTNITWSVVFTANDDYDEIVTGLQATYMGVARGYPGVDGVMSCNDVYSMPDNVKVGCPLQKGKQYRHDTVMQHKIPAPKVTVSAKFTLRDKKKKKDFVCYELMVSLK